MTDSFRTMRLSERGMSREEAESVLEKGKYGVLSVCGGDFPYGIPVNYAYRDGTVFIHHTDKRSLLSDDLKISPKVCFTVVSRSNILPGKYTDAYESAIVFGTASVTDDIGEGLMLIANKYSPGMEEESKKHVEDAGGRCLIITVKVEHITGKHGMRV